ncbi:MAG TPA: hypothetical protein VEF04_06345, partial [Blastocatellia bacterium]|nr:hypothetical protein [Blastocatellia bacterium]
VEVFAYASAAGNDTLSITIKFSDGSVGNINYFANGDRSFPKERIEVYGSSHVAVLDDFRTLEVWNGGKRKVTKRISQDKGFDRELSLFVSAIQKNAEMPIKWESLLLTSLATLRIEDSLRQGHPQAIKLDFEF